jgi:hypothetical protein
MFRFSRGTTLGATLLLLMGLAVAQPLAGQGKKLQVIADLAVVHLGPDSGSPIVETLTRGAIMTLASAIKMRASWFYVYFVSVQTGKTRAGYILDSVVRKLYAELRIVNISSEDEISQPKELDFTDVYRPIVSWGMDRNALLSAEGQPFNSEKLGSREIVRYKRSIIAKRSLVEYVFDSGGLASTRVRLLENYADKNRYIEDYKKLKDYATAKMGQPRADKVIWQDPSCKTDDSRWGTAVGLGQLEFRAEWEIPGGELLITLAGENSRVNLGAEVSGLNHKTASF